MRKISGLMLMIFLAIFLAACGDEADDAEPTEAATGDTAVTETTETETATETETETETDTETVGSVPDEATPSNVMADFAEATPLAGATPVASPVGAMVGATPVATPAGGATPVGADATPVSGMTDATPEAATPAASSIVPVPVSSTDTATAEEPVEMVTLDGQVELLGEENVAYVLSADGCVGLGENRDLRDGRQVLVRDERGTIVGVAELATSADGDGCVWDFSVEVPESAFYEVSVPMTAVMVFSQEEVEASGGEVVLQLP